MKRKPVAALAALVMCTSALTFLMTQPAHADLPECTDADRSRGSGLQIADGHASINFTLARDCAVGLTAYEVRGSDQTKVAASTATTAGTHTLTVALPPCYQVDFHNGATHTRGEGKAIRWAKDCEEVPPSATTRNPESRPDVASPTTSSTSTTSVTTTSAPNTTTTTTPLVSAANAPTTTTAAVLGAVVAQPAPLAELPRTGSRLKELAGVALIGMGLGLGALTAGGVQRKRVLRSASQVPDDR